MAEGCGTPIICDELVDFVVEGMALRKYKSVIRVELETQLDMKIKHTTFDRICSLARQRISVSATRKPKRFYADAVAFYEMIIADPDQPTALKLRAQENLERVVGITGKDGEQFSAEERAAQVQQALVEISDVDSGVGNTGDGT